MILAILHWFQRRRERHSQNCEASRHVWITPLDQHQALTVHRCIHCGAEYLTL